MSDILSSTPGPDDFLLDFLLVRRRLMKILPEYCP